MAPGMLSYFGVAGSTAPPAAAAAAATAPAPETLEKREKSIRALPSSWYTSQEMYDFERRSIFSRRWLFITHRSRLQEPGDFLRYTIAGYDIVISKDRQNQIKAFHNVCRHRAYPVVEPKEGRAKIFACRYHGWSYGLDGKLAKAPNYQDLEGFDKEKNGLLPIHVHIDVQGFVWINMDAKEVPEVPWEEHFDGVDKQERFEKFDFDNYELDHTYQQEGDYNWKILADNFNECYHCNTCHPDVPQFLNTESADVQGKDGHIQHDHASTPEQRARGYDVNSTYYFPNVSMSVSPHWMMIQKFLPDGPKKSSMYYEIYRNKSSSEADFRLIADTYKRVMAEDKVLCDRTQQNLNSGVFINGEMHPRWERGPLYFQQSVREVVSEYYKKEKEAGHEIWPARQQLPEDATVSEEDIEICKGLMCGDRKEVLAW